MTTTIIADDHDLVRRGLRGVLESEGHCRIVAEAGDGLGAAQLVAQHRPALLLLDLNLPRLHGLEVLRQVRTSSPATRTIILSMHQDEPYVIEALRAGAMAYVLKGADSRELLQAVREVIAGRRFLGAALSEWAITALATKPADSDPLASLTPRERMVLQLAAEGLGNTALAEKLFISPRTAETHRTNLLRKLGLQSQTDLVRFAIRRGLIAA